MENMQVLQDRVKQYLLDEEQVQNEEQLSLDSRVRLKLCKYLAEQGYQQDYSSPWHSLQLQLTVLGNTDTEVRSLKLHTLCESPLFRNIGVNQQVQLNTSLLLNNRYPGSQSAIQQNTNKQEGVVKEDRNMNEQKLEYIQRKIDHKYDTGQAVGRAQNTICKHLLQSPNYEAPLKDLQAISKQILDKHNVKIDAVNLINFESHFLITETQSGKIATLLVQKLLQEDSPQDWQEEEQNQNLSRSLDLNLNLNPDPLLKQNTSQTHQQFKQNSSYQRGLRASGGVPPAPQQYQQQSQIQQQKQNLQKPRQYMQPEQQQRRFNPQNYNNNNSGNKNSPFASRQRANYQNFQQRVQFDFSLKEIKSVQELQDLRDFFDQNKYKSLGFDVKVWDQIVSVISLSVHEKGVSGGDNLLAKSWYVDFYRMSMVDRNNTVAILSQIWENRVMIVHDIASFGRAMYKNFQQQTPPKIIDLQVLFQNSTCLQRCLGAINFNQNPSQKDDILWRTNSGKPALYGMLKSMHLIPDVRGLENAWRQNRKKPEWLKRPFIQWQLEVIKEDVCFLPPLCEAIKKSDREFQSNALLNLSRAHVYWDIPLEDRGGFGGDSQTFDRIQALQEGIEYEMKFFKDTTEKYPKFVPSFTTYSFGRSFDDAQVNLKSFREVSEVVGQEYLDAELESVLKVLPDHVACAILNHYVPRELLINSEDFEGREILVNQALKGQKKLVEIIYDDGDKGITLRTRDDDQIMVSCQIRMSQFINKLMSAEDFVREEMVVQQLLMHEYNSDTNSDVRENEDEICKLPKNSEGGHPPFRADNRLGLPGTLHRVSVIFGPTGSDVSGIIYRIGRHLPGAALPFMDLLSQIAESQLKRGEKQSTQLEGRAPTPSILLMGQPGVGKTTLLRDICYQLSEVFGLGKTVVVVDSSLEMGGESRIPHPCLGTAKRVAVANRSNQYEELRKVVQNMNPRVIVVDEIRDQNEVKIIRDISQRGVVMIATIHCPDLNSLLTNTVLRDLVGGIKPVTLGDQEAKHSNQGIKTRLERAGAPVFQSLIEVQSATSWKVHPNIALSVDSSLAHSPLQIQCRRFIQEKQKVMFKLQGESKDDVAPLGVAAGTWFEDLVALKRSLNLP